MENSPSTSVANPSIGDHIRLTKWDCTEPIGQLLINLNELSKGGWDPFHCHEMWLGGKAVLVIFSAKARDFKLEYKVVRLPGGSIPTDDWLNAFGDAGWELTAIDPTYGSGFYIFCRAKLI